MDRLFTFAGIALDDNFLGNPIRDWIAALGFGLVSFAALLFLRRMLAHRARRFAGMVLPHGVRLLITLVGATKVLPLIAVSLLAGSKYLDLGPRAEKVTTGVIVVAVALQLGIWLTVAVRFYLDEHYSRSDDKNSQTMITIVRFVTSVAIWSLVVLLALDNLGFQVKALLTGLGIGGIAVALAVQNVLGDLLASLSIALDRPFGVGDALTLDTGYAGTVEAIGIRSTRLRSVTGEQIVLANSELVKARIRNYGRLQARRSVFRIGIAHGTGSAELAAIPALVRAAVVAQQQARFERAHLIGFSNTSIDFEAAYVVMSADYNAFLDAQQAVNLTLAAEFEERGIEFASLTPAVHAAHDAATAPSVG
jgi:small-conductance mechanosensitive channel